MPQVTDISVEEARALMDASSLAIGRPQDVARIEDREIPGPGGPIQLRLYSAGGQRTPVVVYFHGGGWVIGNIGTHDGLCRALANATGYTVVSVEYRMAPEHPFPAAADDCYAATAWVAEHADELGVDALRLSVAGDSAGGNLATVVPLMARDRGGPAIACQVLIYPATDLDFERPSYCDNESGFLLSRDSMRYFWKLYLNGDEAASNPYAVPMRADVAGLPPAIVITAGYDPLCDDGKAYADKLEAAGVPVVLRHYHDMIHGFLRHLGPFDRAREGLAKLADDLQRVVES